jgi:hypothetical protein
MQRTHAFHAGVKVSLTPSEHERTSKQVVDWSVLYSVGDDRRGDLIRAFMGLAQ